MALKQLLEYLDSDNIADTLDEDTLRDIGESVCQGYEDDNASRKDWLDRNEEYLKLAMQVKEEKNFPWPGAANMKYPILTEASIQFAARATPALIPGTDLVRAFVTGEDPQGLKNDRATRISKHMSYQFLEEMEDWEEDQDRLLHILPIIGCAFKKTYFDTLRGTNVSELVLSDNVVVDYWAKGIESAWRITQVIDMDKNDLHSNITAGLFRDIEVQTPVPEPRPFQGISQDQTQPSKEDDSTPSRILEQHTFLDLDGDGYYEPYIITVDLDSRQVLRIVTRFDEEGISTNAEDEVIRIQPVQYFTKYGFIPNPDGGFYDIGFGLLLTGINETVNTTTNQLLDAGTMAVTAGGFMGRGIRLRGGVYSFKPNEWKQVNGSGDDLRKSIVPMPVREPSSVLFNLLSLMITSAQRIAGTVDSMVGENPGQNQKATTTAITVEQGLKVFNGIYKRVHRSMKKEFKKVYRLNKLYLSTDKYFEVIDPYKPEVVQIAPEDYQDQIDITPTADPNVSSEQMRMAKTDSLLQAYQVSPATMNIMEIQRRMLEDSNQYGIETLLQEPPPPQPDPELIKFQDESEREWAKLRIEALKIKDQRVLDQAKALKEIASAEAQKAGVQLPALMAYLDRIEADMAKEEAELANLSSIGEQNDNEGPTEELEGV